MTKQAYSLLPDNSSALEKGLEAAFADLLNDVPSLYPMLLDADQTPTHMLPYLANDKSVPEWRSDDPEHIKRQLIKNAWLVRRLSGTRAGLQLVLNTLDYESEITPWFDSADGQPYTLEILAWEKDNKPVQVDKAKRLITHLHEAKSCRDSLSLSLVFGVELTMAVSGAAAPPTNVNECECDAGLWPMPDVRLPLSVAAALSPSISVSPLIAAAYIPPFNIVAENAVGGGCYSLSVNTISARAIT